MSLSVPHTPLLFAAHFLKPYWKPILGLFFFAAVGSACESLQPYIIKLLVDIPDAASDKQSVAFFYHVLWIGSIFLALRLVIIAAWWMFQTLQARITPPAEKSLREYLTDRLLDHPYIWFLNGFAGRMGQRVDTATRSFRGLFELFSDDILYIAVRGTTIFCLLLYTDPWLGFGLLGWIFLAIMVIAWFSKPIEEQAIKWIGACGVYTERIVDICANIFSLFSNGTAGKYERNACQNLARSACSDQKEMILRWRRVSAVRTSFNTLLYILLFGVGFWRWRNGSISLGDYAMTISTGFIMVDILDGLMRRLQDVAQHIGNLREALDGLLSDLEAQKEKGLPYDPRGGEIDFVSLSFFYRPNMPVLHNVSFHIAAGEKVALVGTSGAGKTTLFSLLLGLWEIQEGRILIDGQNIRGMDKESFRRQIAVIPQDTSLFHRTLFENIAYGSDQADAASVERAARAANIHDFIARQPQGYATLVGERGLKLSGGQRQRIAVARAIHKNAPIMLLDEATSALDSESERSIQEALNKLMENKTVLAVAHRLSTIARMDRILFIESGQIVEEGTHAELLAMNGRYARLWAMQSGGYLPETEEESLS
jgi:ABC-type multidrug transport system fused ATPase/permease subunit